MYSKKKQNKVRYKSIIVNINDIIKIKASNTQFKTDKTRSEERPARRRYVLQLNCMLDGHFECFFLENRCNTILSNINIFFLIRKIEY